VVRHVEDAGAYSERLGVGADPGQGLDRLEDLFVEVGQRVRQGCPGTVFLVQRVEDALGDPDAVVAQLFGPAGLTAPMNSGDA